MLADSRTKILERVTEADLVLDVGGGAKPFPRADWVIDLMPYAERGLYGPPPDPAAERFSAGTWVQRDICDRGPWPFADRQFDFAVCSHTLEDVRDPVWVCRELMRVSRAGYIEVPSRLEEQTYGIQGPWAGWSHHRWFVDVEPGGLTFVFKHHVLHNRPSDHFPAGFTDRLPPADLVQRLFWEGRFQVAERIFLTAAELDAYLADYVAAHRRSESVSRWWPPSRRRRSSRR
jgi:hypothetical protein